MRKLWLVICLAFIFSSQSRTPSIATDGGGDVEFVDPQNALVEDGSFAEANCPEGCAGAGAVINFTIDAGTFSLPPTATMTGLEMSLKHKTDIATASPWQRAGGSLNLGALTASKAWDQNLTTTLTWETFGGSSDMWGMAGVPTPAEINSGNSGTVQYGGGNDVGSVFVDAVFIIIYYTDSATGKSHKVIGYGRGIAREKVQ